MSEKQEKAKRQAKMLIAWGEDWAKNMPDEWMKPKVWRRISKHYALIKESDEFTHLSGS